jgi:hypothetical protein
VLEALSATARGSYVSPLPFALGHLGLGGLEEMFACLEQALAIGVVDLPEVRVDPRYAPVRRDVRFVSLVQRMRLPA